MPSYEYRCLACLRRFEIFLTYAEYGTKPVICPRCGSDRVERRIGRVRFARSAENRIENLAESGDLDGLDQDPRALGRMMRQMSGEIGEDMGPEFDEVVNRLEAGHSPEQIEQDMPDLGADSPADESGFSGALDDA